MEAEETNDAIDRLYREIFELSVRYEETKNEDLWRQIDLKRKKLRELQTTEATRITELFHQKVWDPEEGRVLIEEAKKLLEND